jgi:hypothetical protein
MSTTARSSAAGSQRVIRVFVSSTFRDMQAEREELVKRIFPQLHWSLKQAQSMLAQIRASL